MHPRVRTHLPFGCWFPPVMEAAPDEDTCLPPRPQWGLSHRGPQLRLNRRPTPPTM